MVEHYEHPILKSMFSNANIPEDIAQTWIDIIEEAMIYGETSIYNKKSPEHLDKPTLEKFGITSKQAIVYMLQPEFPEKLIETYEKLKDNLASDSTPATYVEGTITQNIGKVPEKLS